MSGRQPLLLPKEQARHVDPRLKLPRCVPAGTGTKLGSGDARADFLLDFPRDTQVLLWYTATAPARTPARQRTL